MSKVLLVEDDNNLREIYEARLAAEGYEIVTAKDGEDALAVAKQHKPDLVISDVMMPRISGFEMLDILRNTDGLKNVKIVMLTALGQNDDRTRAGNLGADRYLVKSQVTLEDIVKTADELLNPDAAPAPAATSDETPAAAPAENTPNEGPGAAPASQPTPAPAAEEPPQPAANADSQPVAAPEPAAPTAEPATPPANETPEEQNPAPAPTPSPAAEQPTQPPAQQDAPASEEPAAPTPPADPTAGQPPAAMPPSASGLPNTTPMDQAQQPQEQEQGQEPQQQPELSLPTIPTQSSDAASAADSTPSDDVANPTGGTQPAEQSPSPAPESDPNTQPTDPATTSQPENTAPAQEQTATPAPEPAPAETQNQAGQQPGEQAQQSTPGVPVIEQPDMSVQEAAPETPEAEPKIQMPDNPDDGAVTNAQSTSQESATVEKQIEEFEKQPAEAPRIDESANPPQPPASAGDDNTENPDSDGDASNNEAVISNAVNDLMGESKEADQQVAGEDVQAPDAQQSVAPTQSDAAAPAEPPEQPQQPAEQEQPPAEDENQTQQVAGKKVIQPISSPEKQADINDLAAQEEVKENLAKGVAGDAVVSETGQKEAEPGVTPTPPQIDTKPAEPGGVFTPNTDGSANENAL